MKDNTIEVKELSDLLRFIELQIRKSNIPITMMDDKISELQHVAKMGFDIGKNGSTQFEIGE